MLLRASLFSESKAQVLFGGISRRDSIFQRRFFVGTIFWSEWIISDAQLVFLDSKLQQGYF